MVSIFEIGISQNTKCDNLVNFPNSGHKCSYVTYVAIVKGYNISLCYHLLQPLVLCFFVVISKPDDVTICEGGSTTFTCVLDSGISSDDVQWYRLIMDTITAELVEPDGENITILTQTGNTLNSSLTITNAVKSHTGYYWVDLSFDDVCNVSLTVSSSTYINICT